MKLLSKTTLMILLSVVGIYGYVASCTHKDVVPPAPADPTPVITRGDAVLLPHTMTVGDSTQWKLDKVHSNCPLVNKLCWRPQAYLQEGLTSLVCMM